jgi:hypothetical protein
MDLEFTTTRFRGTNITDSGEMMFLMEKVNRNLKMAPIIKVTFFTASNLVMDIMFAIQAFMRVSFLTVTFMETDYSHTLTIDNTKVSGKMD